MQPYKNLRGQSNVASYQIGNDQIVVGFDANKYSGPMFYKYTYAASGQDAIEHMKQLALQGVGLNSYINTSAVKKQYVSKSSTQDGV